MVNYSPLVKSVAGLQTKYDRSFKQFAEDALSIEDPLGFVFDKTENRERSRLYLNMRDNFDTFQSPFAIAAEGLGQAIYTSTRDAAEAKRKGGFPSFSPVGLNQDLLQDNLMNHWTVSGMLKKVIEGDQTIDFVAQSGSKSLADLIRAVTTENAIADKKVVKRAKIALSGNACAFCRDTANAINGTEPGHEYDKVKFHNSCSCTLVFEFV